MLYGCLQFRSPRRDAKHAAPGRVEAFATFGRPRVEYFHGVQVRGLFQAVNLLADFVAAWITARGDYHTDGCIA